MVFLIDAHLAPRFITGMPCHITANPPNTTTTVACILFQTAKTGNQAALRMSRVLA